MFFIIFGITAQLIYFSLSNKKPGKILLIGLDGAGWNVMTPMIEEGKLPNIKRLMDNGSWGRIETLTPVTSEIIWTTIATGMAPDVHGITANLMQDPATKELIPPTSDFRRVRAIWNILSGHKKRVGVVGYRVSWPVEKVNGVMVSERAYGKDYFDKNYSVPSPGELCTEETFNSFREGESNVDTYSSNIVSQDSFMYNFSKHLLKNEEFDFFCIYLRGIDELSHIYWKYMYPQNYDIPAWALAKYKDVIRNHYIWCDKAIGALLQIIDENTTVIIVSDHGFKNEVFNKNGYYFLNSDDLLEACGLKEFEYDSNEVILEDTQGYLWRNKKNIKITGKLYKEEFDKVRENAKNILQNIKVEETGEALFRVADIDKGFVLEVDDERVNKMADYHILVNGQVYKILDFFIKDSGGHDATDAIIIISGKHIRPHINIKDASVFDMTPTILYMLALPVAKDMPGKVLTSVIDPKFLKEESIRYIGTYEDDKPRGTPKAVRSPEDEEAIKEKMRSLGYIN